MKDTWWGIRIRWIFVCLTPLLTILLCCPATIYGQAICTGTFGDNIFTGGDFGRGSENIVPDDTSFAPGYSYTTSTPPMDGFYTITNDMGRWGNNYGTWISTGDRSDDPLGYMMVVNASYSPGIFYEKNIENLCPNTTFEFSADVLNVVRREVTGHSLPDLDFLINDSVRYSTGQIPQDEQWHNHGFIFELEPGQSSLKLTLVNKAPGGTGNDLALDNITFRPCGPEPDLDLARELYFCEDEVQPGFITTNVDTNELYIQWQMSRSPDAGWQNIGGVNSLKIEQDLSEAGIFYYRYKLSHSPDNLNNPFCVSLSDVVTSTVLPRNYEILDTICMGTVRSFEGRLLTESGTYSATHTSSRGCDSILTLHLTVLDRRSLTFDLLGQNPLCHDSADGRIEVSNATGGYPPYEYSVDNFTNSTGRFEGLEGGHKTIRIRDRYGCPYFQDIELIIPPEFDLYSLQDTQLILGQSLTINISVTEPIFTVTSDPNILGDCDPCHTVTFIPIESTDVLITATNANGCISEESFFINVDDQNLPIAFPNAFSPNGDGVNDDFRLITPPHLINRMIATRILDRWGNEIYSILNQTDVNNVLLWDGHNKGQKAEPGVYLYVVELELINGEKRYFTGDVLVL